MKNLLKYFETFYFFQIVFLTLINYWTKMPPRYYNIQQKERNLYIYIKKDGNPSTKSTRHLDANVNT